MSESPSTLGANGGGRSDNESSSEVELECSICLSTAVHPVQLPCTHIFCFLCVKGSANRSKRCALCRQVIPPHYLFKPTLLKQEDLSRDTSFDDGHQWYYEGNRGWWQYDERTSSELEVQFKVKCEKVEVLIAGFLYVVDFENMIQYRRNDPSRRRRIKRDVSNIPIKGVAGLKITVSDSMAENRREGDGGFEVDTNRNRSGGIQSSTSLPPNPYQSGRQSDNVDTLGGHSPQRNSDRAPVSQSDGQNTEDGDTLNRSASTTPNADTGNIDEVRTDVNRNRSGAVRLGAVGEVAADNDSSVQNVTSDALSSEGPASNARKNTVGSETGTCDLQESQSGVRTVKSDPNHTETSELEGDSSAVNVTDGQLTRQSEDSSPRETTQQHGMQLRMRNGRSVKRP